MTDFTSVSGTTRTETVIERSRFIATAVYVESTDEARQVISAIKKEFADATHNCYAYIVGEESRSSDDGEPQGTAGMPILEAIKRKELNNTLVVVTRYFGGIKLGAAGLVGAYMKSALASIESATLVDHITSDFFKVETDYSDYQKLIRYFSEIGCVTDTVFGDSVVVCVAVPTTCSSGFGTKVDALTSGRAKLNKTDTKYFIYKKV